MKIVGTLLLLMFRPDSAVGADEPLLYSWSVENGQVVCWFRPGRKEPFDREKLVIHKLEKSESESIIQISSDIRYADFVEAAFPTEIALAEYQKKQLDQLKNGFASDFKNFAEKIYQENVKAVRKSLIKELVAKHQGKLESILLPHQLKAMRRVRLQSLIEQKGFVKVLSESSSPLSRQLKVTESQKKCLKTKAVELQKKYEAEIEELILDAREEMFSVLTFEQKQKLKKITGPAAESNKFRENAHKGWLDF